MSEGPVLFDIVAVESDGGGARLVCQQHKTEACGLCCSDFGLLNRLQAQLLLFQSIADDSNARRAFLERETASYFEGGQLSPLSNPTGKPQSPQLATMLDQVLSNDTTDTETMGLLVAYLSYACRHMPTFPRGRIIILLDSVMTSLPSLPMSDGGGLKKAAQQSRAARRAQERAEKKRRKKQGKGKDREYKMNKVGSAMASAIENISEIMGEHNLSDGGSFMQDLLCMGMSDVDSVTKMFAQASVGKTKDDKIEMSDDMATLAKSAVRPLEIMLEHTKDPLEMDDCTKLTKPILLQFLRKHKLYPVPTPSKAVLVTLVKEMRNFVLACMENINNMPDGDEAAAMGAQAMGIAEQKDLDILQKMNAPVKRERVKVNPQIPKGFRMDTLVQWIPASMPKFEDSFRRLRGGWCSKHQSFAQNPALNIHHEVLQTLESLAYVYDFMVDNPGKDMLATIQVFPDTTSEQALAIRPLAASILEGSGTNQKLPVPIIAVEWHLAKRVNEPKKMHEFVAGLRKGTLFQGINPKNLEEFEIVVELLRENRRALDVQNEVQLLEQHATDKGWKFSVVRPADPAQKNGFVKVCALCQRQADKTCSCCGITTYCSRECQTSHWKVHKKTCKPTK